jgi:hypothetical protein
MLSLVFAMKAQEESSTVRKAGGGGFTIGYGNFDVSKLHAFVPDAITKFSNNQLMLGGTGHGFIGKFVTGMSGSAVLGDAITSNNLKIKLSGGLGTLDFGYLVLDKEKVKIFPLLGVGGGGYGVSIAKNQDISTDNIVTDPGREINLSKGGFLMDASINLNFIPILQYDEKEKTYGGFMTGLRVGYVYGLPSSNWSFAGGDISNGPNFGINMFYVKLVIGGFGYSK